MTEVLSWLWNNNLFQKTVWLSYILRILKKTFKNSILFLSFEEILFELNFITDCGFLHSTVFS